MFKVQEENDELNHSMIVLKLEKKEALEKVSNLENEINQAKTSISDAKNVLQKLICNKEETNGRIENLEEDFAHAQSRIDAMTKSMIEKEALGLQAGSPKKRSRKWEPGRAFPILKSKE